MILHTLGLLPLGSGALLGGTAVLFPLLGFEAALVATLKSDADLVALIGQRVYPLAIPQSGSLPCIVYAIPNTERARNLAGYAGVAVARVLFDARATSYATVKAIQEVLRQYDGFDGYLANAVAVMNVTMPDQTDQYEWPAGTGSDLGTHHLTLEFRFKYRESIPAR